MAVQKKEDAMSLSQPEVIDQQKDFIDKMAKAVLEEAMQKAPAQITDKLSKDDIAVFLRKLFKIKDGKKKYYGKAPQGDYITYDTFQTIVREERHRHYKLMFTIMWWLGLRISEVLRIKPEDVDCANPQQVGMGRDVKHCIRIWRKRNKFSMLSLTKALRDEIMKFVRDFHIHADQTIFKIKKRAVQKRLAQKGFTIGGRKRIHPHALRRGFGVWMVSNGTPMNVIQQIYSHEKLSMTHHYLNMEQAQAMGEFVVRQQQLIDMMGGLYGGGNSDKGRRDSQSLR
nr:site-specific integrase [uncultured Nitrososphaera sp.]